MDLRNEKRLTVGDCFVCRWAGKHIVLWPQAWQKSDYSDEIVWRCYVNVHETVSLGRGKGNMRSRHVDMSTCEEHRKSLYKNWVHNAQEEVEQSQAWDRYVERMEE